MSNQNITTDLLVELSPAEQQLLSGGCDNYSPPRRRRGGVRQKIVFSPVINIYPSEAKSTDEPDSSQTSSDNEDQN
ncbi:hypothetical protein PN480_12405 [Dolichospermum circinale CS-1225]|uniref:Uncharacterized protein n=1 Tax=Dolichospermum circinale CS-537/01 TaxID=3021739 RepID=A0ABT5A7V2_9CYAN|nr:hypothetical protein [Dolichospermum circinale]MDB9468198.1 hypothetical protein [Dolichospermum circinale CS-539/09]MDB9470165.1 hypothetical protein [Dolichospermum circinale CS-539]MDB9488009.1 hypothetical protein [Dolichospermum circinale CS-537/01]MDB9522743.1 hypothetical protein [Dolichospermum circinale CS-1225]